MLEEEACVLSALMFALLPPPPPAAPRPLDACPPSVRSPVRSISRVGGWKIASNKLWSFYFNHFIDYRRGVEVEEVWVEGLGCLCHTSTSISAQ